MTLESDSVISHLFTVLMYNTLYLLLLLVDDVEDNEGEERRTDVGDYETAISKAGYGKFHWILLMVCGWANASDAIEVICISFLLPSAQCDLKLTSGDKGWLSAILFVGMMIGGYVWGTLGDSMGRKKILINAMFVNAICGFASSLAQEKITFFILRFLSGVGYFYTSSSFCLYF